MSRITKILLTPLSWLYGLGVGVRNKLYDIGWYKSKEFDIPTICVGNLAVGGTGKTPHIEYLISLLRQRELNVATLSRGYKRKSSGYIEATDIAQAREIGDEPYQIKSKYPEVTVAVDVDRVNGVKKLMAKTEPKIDAILLDDAYQHRAVKAGMNILLTEYSNLFSQDRLMPAGRLREPASEKHRANIVIITKCPKDIKPIDFNIASKHLELFPYQKLFFSRIEYGEIRPLMGNQTNEKVVVNKDTAVLLLSGIASPEQLKNNLMEKTSNIEMMTFADHHDFSKKDINTIFNTFEKMKGEDKKIITTEKDAARLIHHPDITEEMKENIYVYPIRIKILQKEQDKFNKTIIDYVRENKRNS